MEVSNNFINSKKQFKKSKNTISEEFHVPLANKK